MTEEQAARLREELQKAHPDLDVFIFDRGFGVGWVVTVEDERRRLAFRFAQESMDVMGGPLTGEGVPLADVDRIAELWRQAMPGIRLPHRER